MQNDNSREFISCTQTKNSMHHIFVWVSLTASAQRKVHEEMTGLVMVYKNVPGPHRALT